MAGVVRLDCAVGGAGRERVGVGALTEIGGLDLE